MNSPEESGPARPEPNRGYQGNTRSIATPIVWGRVPLRNPNFIGRSELLDAVREGLTSKTNAVLLYALQGLAGIGKTQIAAEYAHRFKHEYDVIWWISADQPELISSSIAGLAPYLNLGSSFSVDVIAPTVINALRTGNPYERWLLIFDNADRPESIVKYLIDGPGHTIITSRNPSFGLVVKAIEVDVFRREESRAFLEHRLAGLSDEESEKLAEALGDLPIALEQAVALQSGTAMPVQEYLDALEHEPSRLLSNFKPTEYQQPVTAAWALSIANLKDELPNSVVLLRTCAFFGPQPIPREVLTEGRGAVSQELDTILRDPILLNEAIGGLGRYSLVQINNELRTLQVHRIVQALVRDELSRRESEKFIRDVHRLLAAATPKDPNDSSSWQRYRNLAGHYRPSGIVNSRDGEIRMLVRNVIRYHYMIGNFDAALQLAKLALASWSGDPETEATDLLAIKRHIGNILRGQGRIQEAFTINEEAVREATEQLGPDGDETLRLTNSHGADLRAVGQFQAAYALDEESAQRHERVFGEQDQRSLRAQNNFAVDLELAGDYAAACNLHQRIYQAGPAVYGRDDHPSVLVTLNNLARATRLSGKYAEGLAISEDVYASCVNALGEDHPITLQAMRDLAIARRLMVGGTGDTIDLASKVVESYEQALGESHPRTLDAKITQVNVLREAGDLGRAIPIAEKTVASFPKVYGEEHPYTYACRGNLALLRRISGDTQEALSLHERAIAGLQATVGAAHCWTLTCAVGLASDLSDLGDLEAARERGEETLTGLRTVLGEGHPIALSCTSNLASDLSALQLEDRAEQLRQEALTHFAEKLGDDHPATKAALQGERLDCDFDPT